MCGWGGGGVERGGGTEFKDEMTKKMKYYEVIFEGDCDKSYTEFLQSFLSLSGLGK